MKKIYSTDDRVMAGHVESLLENNGIDTWVKNQNLSGAIGELPPTECWPEVWVTDDRDYEQAKQIIDTLLSRKPSNNQPWQCDCGEHIEGQFMACWQCGEMRPD